jgi:hypothetical protein
MSLNFERFAAWTEQGDLENHRTHYRVEVHFQNWTHSVACADAYSTKEAAEEAIQKYGAPGFEYRVVVVNESMEK